MKKKRYKSKKQAKQVSILKLLNSDKDSIHYEPFRTAMVCGGNEDRLVSWRTDNLVDMRYERLHTRGEESCRDKLNPCKNTQWKQSRSDGRFKTLMQTTQRKSLAPGHCKVAKKVMMKLKGKISSLLMVESYLPCFYSNPSTSSRPSSACFAADTSYKATTYPYVKNKTKDLFPSWFWEAEIPQHTTV